MIRGSFGGKKPRDRCRIFNCGYNRASRQGLFLPFPREFAGPGLPACGDEEENLREISWIFLIKSLLGHWRLRLLYLASTRI
jgi:hypothetical protein